MTPRVPAYSRAGNGQQSRPVAKTAPEIVPTNRCFSRNSVCACVGFMTRKAVVSNQPACGTGRDAAIAPPTKPSAAIVPMKRGAGAMLEGSTAESTARSALGVLLVRAAMH